MFSTINNESQRFLQQLTALPSQRSLNNDTDNREALLDMYTSSKMRMSSMYNSFRDPSTQSENSRVRAEIATIAEANGYEYVPAPEQEQYSNSSTVRSIYNLKNRQSIFAKYMD